MIVKHKYDIAVVIINYNSSNYTINCIRSILEKTSDKLSFQIIIVDNASEYQDFQNLSRFINSNNFSNLQFVRSGINLGFGTGNMLGVHYSNAKYFAFINNDSVFINDCLNIIVDEMENNTTYAVCGPSTYKEDGSLLTSIDHFASPLKEFLGRKILELVNPTRYPNRKKEYIKPQKAQFISGAFLVIRASDFFEVGGFDTNIFLYFEETDLCKRLEKINKYAYLIPNAKFIHCHGASTPSSIAIKTEHKLSYLYVIRKHYGYFWFQAILNKFRLIFLIKTLFKPRYFPIFKTLLSGASMTDSLKTKQKIYLDNENY